MSDRIPYLVIDFLKSSKAWIKTFNLHFLSNSRKVLINKEACKFKTTFSVTTRSELGMDGRRICDLGRQDRRVSSIQLSFRYLRPGFLLVFRWFSDGCVGKCVPNWFWISPRMRQAHRRWSKQWRVREWWRDLDWGYVSILNGFACVRSFSIFQIIDFRAMWMPRRRRVSPWSSYAINHTPQHSDGKEKR